MGDNRLSTSLLHSAIESTAFRTLTGQFAEVGVDPWTRHLISLTFYNRCPFPLRIEKKKTRTEHPVGAIQSVDSSEVIALLTPGQQIIHPFWRCVDPSPHTPPCTPSTLGRLTSSPTLSREQILASATACQTHGNVDQIRSPINPLRY